MLVALAVVLMVAQSLPVADAHGAIETFWRGSGVRKESLPAVDAQGGIVTFWRGSGVKKEVGDEMWTPLHHAVNPKPRPLHSRP